MTARVLTIGDVHGCCTALETLIQRVGITPADTVVFLGDLIDRGRDLRGVLDREIRLSTEWPQQTESIHGLQPFPEIDSVTALPESLKVERKPIFAVTRHRLRVSAYSHRILSQGRCAEWSFRHRVRCR